MSSATTVPSASVTPPASSRLAWMLFWGLIGGLWLVVFFHIHTEWVVNVVYSYGWAVPLLAAFLVRERWQQRPAPGRAFHPLVVVAIAALLLAAYLPIRVIQEANPDWVKINWSMMGVAAALSLLVAGAVGGVRYVVYFAFPVLFCFTALPWPVWMETALLQSLMAGNAQICAEVLTHLGLPAIAQGNLIQIADRFVNVEEACSGIRSLQTAFMMSLFLGEYYRVSIPRRVAILLLALGVAMFGNVIRTIVLAYLTSEGSIDRWHDTVGTITMIVTLAGVWGAAELIRRKSGPAEADASAAKRALRPIFPLWFAAVGLAWLVLSEGLTQIWYRVHEKRVVQAADWSLNWPTKARDFASMPFQDRSRALMKFDSAENVAWIDSIGYRWQAYLLEWEPGRVSKYLAMSHYPTVCLPATGMDLVAESGAWNLKIDGIHLPFETYVFQEGGRDVFVFHAIIEDRPLLDDFRFRYYQVNSTERIDSVLRGERNLGQKVLGIALRGCASPSEAREIVETALRSMMVVSKSKPASEL